MSDFDDDLLALAEGTSSKRSKKTKKAKRKRDEAMSSASDMDMSADDSDVPPARSKPRQQEPPSTDEDAAGDSDDDDDDDDGFGGAAAKYPLEGRYIDEADRRRILAMTELDREGILSERAEEINREQSRRELRKMVKEKERQENARKGITSTSRSGRERKTTGATKEKAEGIERLRRSRQEKDKRAAVRKTASSDFEEDDEDEQASRSKRKSKANYSDSEDEYLDKPKKPEAEPAGPTLMREITVTRSRLVPFLMAPWFEDWSKGAWVRLGVGMRGNEAEYRLCRIDGVRNVPEKPAYEVEGTKTTMQVLLSHGKAAKYWTINSISNQPPTDKEFSRLMQQLKLDDMSLPSAKEAESIKKRLDARQEYVMTEADLAAALAKKGPRLNSAQSRAKLLMERDFARSAGDAEKEKEIEEQLAALNNASSAAATRSEESEVDRLRRVNERNRALNREEVAKAEARHQEERRRQAAALARGDQNVKIDPSARVKTMARLKYDRETPTGSRQGTPAPAGTSTVPGTPGTSNGNNGTTAPSSPASIASRANKFDQSLAKRVEVEIDLDF